MRQRTLPRSRRWLALVFGAVLVIGSAGSAWALLHPSVGPAPAPAGGLRLPGSVGRAPAPAPSPLLTAGDEQDGGAGDGAVPPAPLPLLAPPTPAVATRLPPGSASGAVVIRRVTTTRPYVAITVDDFYTANYQWQTAIHELQAANALHAPLTLCPAGSALVAYTHKEPAQAQAIKQLVAAGTYEFCDHTYSHPVMPRLGGAAQSQEMRRGAAAIRAFFGRGPIPVFRPPFGSWDSSTQWAAAAVGFPRIVTWSVDTGDSVGPELPPERLVANAVRARAGDIILLHANRRSSAVALPLIIQRLRASGLEPVLLATLLASGTAVEVPKPTMRRPQPAPGRQPSSTPALAAGLRGGPPGLSATATADPAVASGAALPA